MVITDLSDELMDEGAKIVEMLDQSGVEVPAALWILFPDRESWKLALSLPAVQREGPMRGYRLVQKALEDLRTEVTRVNLEDVTVLRPDAPLLRLVRKGLGRVPGISRHWLKGNAIDGELVPDSLVYRVT